jgi:hypothetical protein
MTNRPSKIAFVFAHVLSLAVVPTLATAQDATAPAADPAAPAAPGGAYGAFADVAVSDLLGQRVQSGSGGTLGDIERLVETGGGVVAVLGVGGFLGLGERDVPVPLAELAMVEGTLTAATLTREDLEEIPVWDGEGVILPTDVTVSGTPVPEEPTPIAPVE